MTLTITGATMTSDQTARTARLAPGGQHLREVSWLPGQVLDRTSASIVGTLTSPRLAGLRAWQGRTYPATGWPAILDTDTHERLARPGRYPPGSPPPRG
jgi:hypothetical protein